MYLAELQYFPAGLCMLKNSRAYAANFLAIDPSQSPEKCNDKFRPSESFLRMDIASLVLCAVGFANSIRVYDVSRRMDDSELCVV